MADQHLTARDFRALTDEAVRVEDLLRDLAPPRHFAHAAFSNYRPDPRFTSQRETLERLSGFVESLSSRGSSPFRRFFGSFGRSASARAEEKLGVYLDGGFGIGKTHLLAAAYHLIDSQSTERADARPAAYLTFQELMFLVGLQGLERTVVSFANHRLLVIDEFELDDPANTRIATNLLGQLFDRGVSILSSSNTPPGALGEGKFSVEAFRRELGVLFDRFESLRIDGEDYRRRLQETDDAGSDRWVMTTAESISAAPALPVQQTLRLTFAELLDTLASAHPMRIRKALANIRAIEISDVTQLSDPHAALRFVYLVDKIYDHDILLSATSHVGVRQLFSPAIFHGGDTKKYLRAISRLVEITSVDTRGA